MRPDAAHTVLYTYASDLSAVNRSLIRPTFPTFNIYFTHPG